MKQQEPQQDRTKKEILKSYIGIFGEDLTAQNCYDAMEEYAQQELSNQSFEHNRIVVCLQQKAFKLIGKKYELQQEISKAKGLRDVMDAQKDYIKFLSEMIEQKASYLQIRNMSWTNAEYEKGQDFRIKIEMAERNLDESSPIQEGQEGWTDDWVLKFGDYYATLCEDKSKYFKLKAKYGSVMTGKNILDSFKEESGFPTPPNQLLIHNLNK
jgi:hypothetical protein